MKFLCPSCKAKYQIADEKVAGRSVRMKCRKCGFVIPLSEVPPAPESVLPEGGTEPLPVVPKAPKAPSELGAEEKSKPRSPAAAPVAAKPAEAKPGLPRPTLADAKPSSPRPAGASAVPAPAAVTPKPATGAQPAAPGASVGSSPTAAPSPTTSPAPSPTTRIATSPGKPGLGTLLSKPAPAPAGAKPGLASLGPKPQVSSAPKAGAAAAAAVAATPPKPAVVPNKIEVSQSNLLAAVEDEDEDDGNTMIASGGALAAAFGALVGSSGQPLVASSSDEWFVGINEVPVGPIRLAELRKRALLGAVSLESMVWRDGLDAWRPLKTFPELVAVLEESFSNVRASRAPLVPPTLAESGAPMLANGGASGALLSSAATTGQAVVTDDIVAAGLPRARTPVAAWLAIVMALAFGLVLGFVFFSSQKPPETIVKIVEVPAKPGEVPVAAAPPAPDTANSAVVADTTKPKTGTSKNAGTKTTDPAAPATTGGGLTGLKGLGGLNPATPGGPGAPGPGGTPTGSGGQLDAGQIQSTVGRYTGSVKRSCWQPALDARDPSAPTSARVMVTITVGGSGSVQNVSTSGEPRGYPGLASCIAGRVRAWQFPATGGTTTVNVPFVFAAQ